MIHLIGKTFLRKGFVSSRTSNGFLFSTASLKPESETSVFPDQQSLTVSYLQSSLGLPLESAILASKKLKIEATGKPNAVLKLLKAHGFSQTLIRNLVMSRPAILQADPDRIIEPNFKLFASLGFSTANLVQTIFRQPGILNINAQTVVEFFRSYGFSEKQISVLTMKRPALFMLNVYKNLKPKLEYFKSLGFSDVEITKMLSVEPFILERSLENQIMPAVEAIRCIVCTNENVLKTIKTCCATLVCYSDKVLKANMSTLLCRGVPESNLQWLIMKHPRSLFATRDRFNEAVGEAVKLGLDPNRVAFVEAVRTAALLSKSCWDRKWEAFASFGLSNEEIISAFRLRPTIMTTSKEKIRKLMDFYVNVLKLEPSLISRKPRMMVFSLEKRIIPRCSVLQLLVSKSLVKSDTGIIRLLTMTDEKFVDKFVNKYSEVVPEVVRAHQGKIGFAGFPFDKKT